MTHALRLPAARIFALGLLLGSLPACAVILGVDDEGTLATSKGGAGAGGSGGPVACDGTLRVRITTDNTGTAIDIAQPYNKAVFDYLRDLEAEGGVRGCHIDVDMRDAHYDATVTHDVVTAWSKQPEWPEVSAVFVFGTGPTMNVSQMPEMAGKIIIPGSYAGAFTSPAPVNVDVNYQEVNAQGQAISTKAPKTSPGYPFVFFPATDYSTGIRIGIQAAWKVQQGKMAMVYDKTCAYCTDPLAAGKSYIPKLPGMELGGDIDSVPQTSDTAQVAVIAATIKSAVDEEIARFKADPNYHPVKWYWCGNSVTSCAGVAKGAGQGNKDILAQIADPAQRWQVRVIANNWGIGETSSSLCGAGGGASDCDDVLHGIFPVPRYGDTSVASGMQAMMELHDRWAAKDGTDPLLYQDVRYVQGYAAALMWRKAVEAALDAGHATPTGTDLKTALETFKQVVVEGMTAGPISFSSTDHRPQGNEWLYYLHQGALTYSAQVSLSLDPLWLGY